MPPAARKVLARWTLAMKASRPSLLKPSRLISAWAAGTRNMRGLGLPGWPTGVTVPTSMKPKPIAPRPSMQRPFLSSPAARPTRLGKRSPATTTGVIDTRLLPQRLCGRVLQVSDGAQGQLMGGFRVEAEQERAGEGVGDEGHNLAHSRKQIEARRMTQDELKTLVGQAALAFVVPGSVVGVGTGSTVNKFIDALATMQGPHRRRGVELGAEHASG